MHHSSNPCPRSLSHCGSHCWRAKYNRYFALLEHLSHLMSLSYRVACATKRNVPCTSYDGRSKRTEVVFVRQVTCDSREGPSGGGMHGSDLRARAGQWPQTRESIHVVE